MLVTDIYRTQIFSLQETVAVAEAIKLFIQENHDEALIMDSHNKLVGTLCVRDIASAVIPGQMQENVALASAMYQPNFFVNQCMQLKQEKVKSIMQTKFVTVTPEQSVMEATAAFLHNHLSILPVCVGDKVIGVVTKAEIKKAFGIAMEVER